MSERKQPSVLQVVASVVSAAFGVQSSANRERDFSGGTAAPYIIAGIIFTVLFILAIVGVVRWVLS